MKNLKHLAAGLAAYSLVFSAVAQGPSRNDLTVVLDATGVSNLGIETTSAEEATFARTVFALGEIDHTCDSHSVLSSRISGRIIDVGIHEGEFATKDEVLARIESRQPGNPPPVIELKSPANGLVIRSQVHLGGPVEPEQKLLEIYDLSTVWVVAKVPQDQGPVLVEGLEAEIRVAALGDEKRNARFLRLGTDADPAKGVIDAVFELANPGNKLRPGMRAEVLLLTGKREGVLSIPRDALQGDRSNRFVFIKDYELENTFVRVPVTVGETSGDRVEIVAGLMPGDEVVSRGAYELSFAGKGNASLKEALDAAHGHPHKEDGSELSAEEAEAADEGGHHHDHGTLSASPLTIFLAVACVVLLGLLLASPVIFRSRSKI